MGFILRAVLILIVFAFVVYVIKAIARLSSRMRVTIKDVQKIREQVVGRTTPSAEMVRCASCGAFVSSKDAVTLSSGKLASVFCSHECMRLHVAK